MHTQLAFKLLALAKSKTRDDVLVEDSLTVNAVGEVEPDASSTTQKGA